MFNDITCNKRGANRGVAAHVANAEKTGQANGIRALTHPGAGQVTRSARPVGRWLALRARCTQLRPLEIWPLEGIQVRLIFPLSN